MDNTGKHGWDAHAERGSAFAQTRTATLIFPMSLNRQRSIFSFFSYPAIGGPGEDSNRYHLVIGEPPKGKAPTVKCTGPGHGEKPTIPHFGRYPDVEQGLSGTGGKWGLVPLYTRRLAVRGKVVTATSRSWHGPCKRAVHRPGRNILRVG